jgi:GT2 family glycosyltransferase
VSKGVTPRLSAMVVAFRSGLLPACLRALVAHAPRDLPLETVVVLNEGAAGESKEIQAEFPGVRCAVSPVNLGLAGAANLARSMASGELLFLLHDDAEIESGCIEALVAAAEADPRAGAIGGLMLDADGRPQSAGGILWRDGTTSPPWSGEPPPAEAFVDIRPVDYVATAAMLVRARTWDAIGGLDERFYPGYYVDVDAAMAVREIGQVVRFEPRARCRHRRAASSSPRFRAFVSERNRAAFLSKWSAALEAHEPAFDRGPAAIERALARARCWGPSVAAPSRAPVAPRPASAATDRHAYVERELELQRDFSRWLLSEIATLEAVRALRPPSLTEVEATRRQERGLAELTALRERVAGLEAMERLRWWRLYRWLLPFLRWVRRISDTGPAGNG